MKRDDFEKELRQAKQGSLAHMLIRTGRLVNEYAIQRFREHTGMKEVRTSHLALFAHIDLEGTRLSVLTERLGVSKQAVHQLVEQLVQSGSLERRPDPKDGRAKLIAFTERGQDQILEGLALLRSLEEEFAQHLGPETIESLQAPLARLMSLLETLHLQQADKSSD